MLSSWTQKIRSLNELENKKKFLLKQIKEKCLFKGNFVLASGQESKFYLDTRLITLCPKASFLISQIFYFYLSSVYFNLIKEPELDLSENFAVAGPSTGANPIVSGVSLLSYLYNPESPSRHLRAGYIRKKAKNYGRTKLIEGPISSQDKVIILEDVVTTGMSSIQAIKNLKEELNCQVVALFCIVQRDSDSFKLISEQTGITEMKAIFQISKILDTDKI